MKLPEGKIIIVIFVIIIAILAYFGIDLKMILHQKISDLIPPIFESEQKPTPIIQQINRTDIIQTMSPKMNDILTNRGQNHPTFWVST
jgi:hypothetical protein